MLKDNARQKLINAIIYFAQNTDCPKTKLLKLLFTLDFEHFRQTGRSVTGLTYYAWKLGPVPVKLLDELDTPASDINSIVELRQENFYGFPGLRVLAKQDFDPSSFTRRELRLLETIASEHGGKSAKVMVDATHKKGAPWDLVYADGRGANAPILYELILAGEPGADAIRSKQQDRADFSSYLDSQGQVHGASW